MKVPSSFRVFKIAFDTPTGSPISCKASNMHAKSYPFSGIFFASETANSILVTPSISAFSLALIIEGS